MSLPAASRPELSVPLCVDLDGTVIETDLLWESLVRLVKRNPLAVFPVLIWWLHGRAHLKARIAARVKVPPGSLPYHQPLLEFLRDQRRLGRTILLVTASDAALVQPVAAHLGIFDEVLASDGRTNLRGKNKAARLVSRFGSHGFDYAGNSVVDLPVWEQSRQAIVVNASDRLAARARRCATIGACFPPVRPRWRALLGTLLRA
jgi:hypothetical protein